MKTLHRTLPFLLALLTAAQTGCALRSANETGNQTSPDAVPAAADNTEAPGSDVSAAADPAAADQGTAGPGEAVPGNTDPAPELPPEVSPVEPVTPSGDPDPDADFYPDGLFIYGDAVYSQAYYSETNSRWFAQTALYYSQLFGTQVSMVIAPLSSMVIHSPKLASVIPDQKIMMDDMRAMTDPAVNFVNTYEVLAAHDTEYLFFRTDHHWTQRGAYYAYAEFAESVGLTPTPLENLTYAVRNDDYHGSMYQWTMDERVKTFSDQVEAWYPTKAHSMVTVTPEGETISYDSSIVSVNNTYVTFIAGDNKYTVITVPDNPQDMTCLVLKDSFGNAFVPFLCEHYGTIVVVDPRYADENIYEKYAGMNFRDIIFVNNIEAANSYVWSKLYMAAVGVALPE